MERIILHSDLNNFYASVERKLNPDLISKPIAVCGSVEERHGIVLAKSEEAKKFGVSTGDTVWQAKKKCKDLIVVPPHFDSYIEYSKKVRAIYAQYTDLLENYGIDECWLDITKSTLLFPKYDGEKYSEFNGEKCFSDGFLRHLADHIRTEVKSKIGVTVSCGISFNKIFAKLGSDMKKPDGTTVISKPYYKDIIYGLPVEELLFVGYATKCKLASLGITTIGHLAAADPDTLYERFGKVGLTLYKNARGENDDPVSSVADKSEMKSIGNSSTYSQDITTAIKVKRMLYVLSESVATRLRESEQGLANTVHLWVRYTDLSSFSVQKKVRHTALCSEIAKHAYDLFEANVKPPYKIRSLGVSVSGFDNGESQVTFDEEYGNYNKKEKLERVVDEIRKKHGYDKIQRASVAADPNAAKDDVKKTHVIKPARTDF